MYTVDVLPVSIFSLVTSILCRRVCSCICTLLLIWRNIFYKYVLLIRWKNNHIVVSVFRHVISRRGHQFYGGGCVSATDSGIVLVLRIPSECAISSAP